MARSAGSDVGSLELLLDTICNTFGGIVFLALLVCLLAQNAGHGVARSSDVDATIARFRETKLAQFRLDEIERELSDLEQTRTQQIRLAQSLEPSDAGAGGALAAPEAYGRFRVELEILSGTGRELAEALRAAEREQQEVRQRAAEAKRQLERAEAAAARAGEVVEAIKRDRGLKLRLPMARRTTKRQVPVLVCHGRMRLPLRYAAGRVPVGRNDAEVEASAPRSMLRPADLVPASGTPIDDSDAGVRAVRQRVAGFDPAENYLHFAVWPDSFAEFRTLRDQVVELGFEYQVLLLSPDEPVHFGGGGPDEVQ